LWSQYQGAGLSSEDVLASSFVEASAALLHPVINLVPFVDAFFDYAYNHFIQNTGKHFNFIRASRLSLSSLIRWRRQGIYGIMMDQECNSCMMLDMRAQSMSDYHKLTVLPA
jgi:hypothetical protein